MGVCYSEPVVEAIEKEPKVSFEVPAWEDEPREVAAASEKSQIPYSLAADGLDGRLFSKEEIRFLEKVQQDSACVLHEDLPLKYPAKMERKFDIDSFIQLCSVIKVSMRPSVGVLNFRQGAYE